MSEGRPTRWAVGLGLAAASTVVALSVAELALRAFAPVEDPYASRKSVNLYVRSRYPPNLRLTTEAEDGLPGVRGQNRFTTNNWGFRGDALLVPKPQGEVRVFLVGGSTTECLFLDDEDSLNAVVQRALQRHAAEHVTFRVFGAGKSGDRSDDHVSMIVHRLVQLEPDAIVVFAGFNDLLAVVNGYDFVEHAFPNQNIDEGLGFWRLARMIATETQLGRRVFYLLKGWPAPDAATFTGELPLKSLYGWGVQRQQAAPGANHLPPLDLRPFDTNLRTIAGAARAHGVEVVFMTQQSTWNSPSDVQAGNWHWMRYANEVTYDEEVMHHALDAVNDVTRTVGRELGIPVYDLARSIPKSLEFFYDDVHFNVRGAAVAGEALALFMLTSTDVLPD